MITEITWKVDGHTSCHWLETKDLQNIMKLCKAVFWTHLSLMCTVANCQLTDFNFRLKKTHFQYLEPLPLIVQPNNCLNAVDVNIWMSLWNAMSCAVLMCSKVNITFWQFLWIFFSWIKYKCIQFELPALTSVSKKFSFPCLDNQPNVNQSLCFPLFFDLFACYVSLKSLTNKSKIPSDLRKGLSLALCVLVLLSLSLSFLSVCEHRDSLWFVPCRLWNKRGERDFGERNQGMATLKTQSTKTKQGIRAILYNKTSHSCAVYN